MEQFSGRVARVKGQGFILEGREGWLNISRFADGVSVPAIGDVVAVELDAKGYVRKVAATSNGRHAPASGNGQNAARGAAITRLALLNTATAILGGGPGAPVEPAEV